jgi:HEAT repeat protein
MRKCSRVFFDFGLAVSLILLSSMVPEVHAEEITITRAIDLFKDADILNDQEAIDALVARGPVVLDTILPLLPGASRDMKAALIEVIGRVRDVRGFEPLKLELDRVKLVRQKAETFADSYNRIMIIKAFGEMGDKRAIPILRQIKVSEDVYERTHAGVGLDKLGDEGAFAELETIMTGTEPNCRNIIALDLGRAGYTKAIPLLLKTLQDEVWFVRASAVDSLAAIGDPSVIPQLESMLKDRSPYVRTAAKEALEKLKKRP